MSEHDGTNGRRQQWYEFAREAVDAMTVIAAAINRVGAAMEGQANPAPAQQQGPRQQPAGGGQGQRNGAGGRRGGNPGGGRRGGGGQGGNKPSRYAGMSVGDECPDCGDNLMPSRFGPDPYCINCYKERQDSSGGRNGGGHDDQGHDGEAY